MKATRKDHVIIKCARRLIDKMDAPSPPVIHALRHGYIVKNRHYTLNGEFTKDVQLELKRMKKHCEQARKEEEEWKLQK